MKFDEIFSLTISIYFKWTRISIFSQVYEKLNPLKKPQMVVIMIINSSTIKNVKIRMMGFF